MSLHPLLKRLARHLLREDASPRRRVASRPLRLLRLERRRVLSADFSFAGGGLVLDAFDAGESLTISQDGDRYNFTVGSGGWNHADGSTRPPGMTMTGGGATLSLDADTIAQLTEGITIAGDGQAPLDVVFGDADFSQLGGALSVTGATSIGQQSFSLLTAPAASPVLLVSPPSGTVVSSLNIAGDLVVTAFGPITDEPGTEIRVSDDAIFNSIGNVLAADFNLDQTVDAADQAIWSTNFGMSSGVTAEYGDANGDGRIDTLDSIMIRESLGTTAAGGIFLADFGGNESLPADILIVEGDTRFLSVPTATGVGGGFDIFVGVDYQGIQDGVADRMTDSGATVDLGSTSFETRNADDSARGDVTIFQDNDVVLSSIPLVDVTAGDILENTPDILAQFGDNFAGSLVLTSEGAISDRDDTSIDVNTDATFIAYGENGTGQSIVLADTVADQLRVGGDATLQSVADEMGAGGGADILVGIDPTTPDRMTDSGAAVNLGGTNFDSRSMGDTTRGDVSLLQENRIEFFGERTTRSRWWRPAGSSSRTVAPRRST